MKNDLDRGDDFPMYGTVNDQLAGLRDPSPKRKEMDPAAAIFIVFFGFWAFCGLVVWARMGFPMP